MLREEAYTGNPKVGAVQEFDHVESLYKAQHL